MTNALETYLHQIGLVTDRGPMLLPISQRSGDAAARDDRPTVFSGQLQQQQQQQPTTISSTKDVSLPPPSVAKFRSAADGILIYTNPVIEGPSLSGPSDLGPVSVTVTTSNYPSLVEPTYVHSTNTPAAWSKASDSSSRSFLFGDAVVNRHPNAVTTVTVSNTPSDLDTKSSHQNNNVTQVSHVTSKLSSPPNTRQTVVQCSSNSYTLSHNTSQVTSQTSGIPTISYPVMQSVHAYPNPLATAQADSAISNSLNFKDITQATHIYDRSCLVDVDRLSYDSPGVSGSDLSRDSNSLVISIRQNLSDILHLNQTPFDQSHLNQQNQSTIFNRAPTFDDHCSGILSHGSNRHLPSDDSKRKERQDIVLSPSTLSSAGSSTPPLSQSSNVAVENQPTMIKSSLKKEAPPNGVRKAVTFCAADLVHVEEYTLSPATPPNDLFLPLDQQLENISEDTESVLFGVDSAELWPPGTHENYQGSWFNSSTDTEPYIFDFPSPTDESRDCAPLSFANDVFGRTTIVLTSGTFRPGESGKLNGKTVSDLSGSHDHRRTLSTGTLSGLRSHRTLVKVNFIQGLLDINHNPGQTAEADSKAVQDNGSGTGIVSTLNYCRGIFHENLKNPSMKEFPNEQISAQKRVDQKICHKLSRYKHKLIAAIVGVFILLSLAIGLGVGLNRK